jgi:hypothetical protein
MTQPANLFFTVVLSDLGGGKSYLLRWCAVRQLMYITSKYGIKNPVGMVATENYPSLKDRQLQKISTEFPPWLGKSHGDHKDYGRCFIINKKFGGGVIAFRNLDDSSKYQSAEFVFIFVDELTKNDYETFTFLRTRLRCPGVPDYELKFMGATNPGGVGHGWCKAFWVDRIFGDEWKGFEDSFKYIQSKATDNPHLDQNYYRVLDTLPEALRKAFRDGDWDIFVGQAFPEFSKDIHVLPDSTPIPAGAPCYMTYDWGFGKPFSIGWWYIDNDGRLIRFDEWYGWNGTPDCGLRMVDSDVAYGIVEREKEYRVGEHNRSFMRIAGSDIFQKRPDYKGGGQGKSTAEVMSAEPYNLHFSPGDSLRVLKIRQFRERLKVRKSDGRPMLYVYERCKQFIRTIPNLILDKTFEDIDSTGEDHVYDEVCNLCMARPITPEKPVSASNEVDKRLEELEKLEADNQYDRYEQEAMHDFSMLGNLQ